MTTRVGQPVSRRLTERFCPKCGYRGPELQGPRGVSVFLCASCGEDLYTRPARSYLEMEGLVDERAEIIRFVATAGGQRPLPAKKARRRRFWSSRMMRRMVFGTMFIVASLGFFLLVSLAAVAVLSS